MSLHNERRYAPIGIETINFVVEWTHDAANDERQSSLYRTFAGSDRQARRRFCSNEYKEGDVAASLLKIGPEIREMSDSEIVELHNETLRDKARRASEYKQVAVEMPLGSAQIEYFARCDQWVPRGTVLRCLIRDSLQGQLLIRVDEQDLRLKQFGKLLSTYEGWGMRIEFVPQEEVHRRPVVEVREPTEE